MMRIIVNTYTTMNESATVKLAGPHGSATWANGGMTSEGTEWEWPSKWVGTRSRRGTMMEIIVIYDVSTYDGVILKLA